MSALNYAKGTKVSFKFKNEIKLEYIWTTTETGFAERKDLGAGSPRVAQIQDDGEAPVGSLADGSSSSNLENSNGHARQTMDVDRHKQEGNVPSDQLPLVNSNGDGKWHWHWH